MVWFVPFRFGVFRLTFFHSFVSHGVFFVFSPGHSSSSSSSSSSIV